ncbi:MAG: hypothetical protein ACKVHU_14210 [Acidimicrobiales bacterium]|jgi:alkylation response protein AidB-like acyl-CoA dehydrogenase
MTSPGDDRVIDPIEQIVPSATRGVIPQSTLDRIAAQAEQADQTRSVDPDVISLLKGSDVMRLAGSKELGGGEASINEIGRELEAVAARCASTAWTLWNHLSVFHLFVGTLGPDHVDFLRGIVEAGQWVSFPAGAGSGLHGRVEGDQASVSGIATWGSGSRYADHVGAVFAVSDESGKPARPLDLRFTIVSTSAPGLTIDPTWDGSGVRASATDDIRYSDVTVDLGRCVPWFGANRAESLRTVPVIHHRYREDWVGLSDLWLGWMGVGLVRAALTEACAEIRHRKAIMGHPMATRPTVQVNLGRATSLLAAAAASIEAACREVDERIDTATTPTEADYLRQMAVISMALNQLDEAMSLLARTLGGAALREGAPFERRRRDFRAFPVHINAHQDRVTHQLGRYALGIELDAF